MSKPMCKVVNKKKHKPTADDVYIGRPSKWGNPFVIGRDGTRAEVIRKYEAWLLLQPDLLAALPELRGKTLVCFCEPAACHGDVAPKEEPIMATKKPAQPLRRSNDIKRSPKPSSSGGLSPPTVDELTAAFDELVDALMEHRRRPGPPQAIECYSFNTLLETPEEVLQARDLVADPIGYALRRGGLKKLARLLAAEMSMHDLQLLAERHGDIDPRRISMLDHVFDGSTSKDGALWVA